MRSLLPLFRALESSRPDIVVTNTVTAPLGAIAAARRRPPHVWFLHEFGAEDYGLRFDLGRRAGSGAVRRLSDAVLVTEALRSYFAQALGVEPHVAYHAVDVQAHDACAAQRSAQPCSSRCVERR
jgi:hypothetical protein